jgi:molecular chaperone DnaJ
VLGSEVKVKTLYGDIRMKIDPGTQHNEKKKISNYGVQKLPPNHHQKGNHYVTIKVRIPKTLSAEQRKAMEYFRSLEEA